MGQNTLGKVLKALYAAAVTALGSLSAALSGNETISHLTSQQWTSIALATFVAAGGVFGLAGWAGPKVNGKP